MIDLHTHSTASDGSYSPAALMELAASKKLNTIALTDHDTMAGIPEAAARAKDLGIRLIPGTELGITRKHGDCHLLGLGLYKESSALKKILKKVEEGRYERNMAIISSIRDYGIPVEYDDIEAFSKGKVMGRLHFAAFLVTKKLVKNTRQAFDRFLAQGRPFFHPKTGVEMAEATEAIHEAGGVAILAHPMSLYLSWGKLPAAIAEYKEMGLDGLEAWHPGTRQGSCIRLQNLAEQTGMLISAGSDFHGAARPERRLGMVYEKMPIEDHFISIIPDEPKGYCGIPLS